MQNKIIPYGRHYIDEDDIEAVADVLRHGWITQGPKIAELETAIATYVGAKYAVAVTSATTALHLAYLSANLKDGSKVVTSPNTFVASANCILYGGGTPVFCDINAQTLNMDTNCFEEITGRICGINAVIPVHFGGLPCDMEAISTIAEKKDILIIEDASQAFGATYRDGSLVGNCKYSQMTVFSLHPVKGITSGEGGIITTNSKEHYDRLISLRSHGINKGAFALTGVSKNGAPFAYPDEAMEGNKPNPWYYEMQELGYNYRITDFQCALALSQLNKADLFLKRRKEIVNQYDNLLVNNDHLTLTQTQTRHHSANHLYVLRINFEGIGKSRGDVMRDLMSKGIGTQVHYIPVTRQPYYNKLGFKPEDYPETEKYYRQTLTIPVFYDLTNLDIKNIIEQLKPILS